MTFTHDDIRDRLVDFLYGELDGDARIAFDAHLAGCEPCRAEVAALQRTRIAAREVVRAGLDEAPPDGVRARVLAAAVAGATGKSAVAAGEGGAVAGRAAVEAVRKPSRRAAGEAGAPAGPLAWLRARWAVPMFVTVAAMGALLLVRETVFREARKPLGESPAPQATSAAPRAPTPTAPAATGQGAGAARDESASPPEAPAGAEGPRGGADQRRRSPSPVRVGASRSAEPRAPAAVAKNDAARSTAGKGAVERKAAPKVAPAPTTGNDDALDGLLQAREKAPRPAEIGSVSGAGRARSLPEAQRAEGLAAPASKPAPMVKDRAERQFAQPPPAPAAAPASAPELAGSPAAGSAAPEARALTSVGQKKAKAASPSDKAEVAADVPAMQRSARPGVEAEAEAQSAAAPQAPEPVTVLAARAERLMASRRWAEAAAAYKELLARFPKHEQAPNWQRRLSVVEAAARSAPAAGSSPGFATPPPPK